MRYPPQFLDELRARLPVSEVVGKRVKLKKAGREWKGLSPFQSEKTPSFTVNDQKGFYHDFSSGKHGDIFRFLMETEGVSFTEAVERIAAMAGVPLPAVSAEDDRVARRRRTLHEVMKLAADYFAATLASRVGARARGYLADRAIAPATQLTFGLGYATADRFALKEHLGGLGVSVDDMIETGLLIAGEDIPLPYDRFRDRIMFPITDARGQIIAFGGRAMERDVPAKYLNSPETVLFHKGDNLYNRAAARNAVHHGAPLIVVEGYIDVIAMASAGYEGTVAPLGTALTDSQLRLLWAMADEPVLCFDGDKAGQRAAGRAAAMALPLLRPGKSLRFALLPEGQDPDDLVRAGGRGAVEDVLAASLPLVEIVWRNAVAATELATPEQRAALEGRLAEMVRGIDDPVVRKYYGQDFGGRLKALWSPAQPSAAVADYASRPGGRQPWGGRGYRPASSGGGDRMAPPRTDREAARGRSYPVSRQLAGSSLVRGSRSPWPRRDALILKCLINHPWLVHEHLEEVAALEFASAEARQLKDRILMRLTQKTLDPAPEEASDTLIKDLLEDGFNEQIQRLEDAITTTAVWGAGRGAAIDDVKATWHQLVSLHQQRNALTRELKDAELALANDTSEANWAWVKDVQARLQSIDGTEASVEGFGEASGRFSRGV